jgi:hypothetical protein
MVKAHPKPSHSDPYEGKELGGVIEEKVAESIAIPSSSWQTATYPQKSPRLLPFQSFLVKKNGGRWSMPLKRDLQRLSTWPLPGGSVYCLLFDELKSCVLKLDSQLEIIRDIKLMGSNSPKFLKKYNEPEYCRCHTIIVQRLEEHAKQLGVQTKILEEQVK